MLTLAIVVAAAIGCLMIYSQFSDTQSAPENRLANVALEIEDRIGAPFLEAWAGRDLEQMALICRGEFAASVPEYATWNSVDDDSFEIKSRVLR